MPLTLRYSANIPGRFHLESSAFEEVDALYSELAATLHVELELQRCVDTRFRRQRSFN